MGCPNILSRIVLILALFLTTHSGSCQISADQFKPDPAKEKMYLPYLAAWYGDPNMLQEWKKSNILRYYQELWYFCQSFYIKRNHLSEGVSINEAQIDISRFESQRKKDAEVILELPGYRDALVLLPGKDLLYKPEFVR